ncbi:MAG: sugar phosphate nucleotidyltransferase [Myxococcota bacterium]|nr:sugar phosphate nucleotidyltransferase [Myxococcota bacterium]
MKLFVPGRICLFGEHSDWAAGYRNTHADISPGYAIIAGTNQGIHAEVKPHPSRFILKAVTDHGEALPPFEQPMDRQALLEVAEAGGFFSYAAGVAYQALTRHPVGGLEITNTLTDIPIQKGLSSSAALCVLVARAFNRVYDLELTTRDEMDLAYRGEITTPSRCGRLDQGCAFGNRPIQMRFDGDQIDVSEITLPKDLHLVIVDLNAHKDTKEILSRLNDCFPIAENEIQENVQHCLGETNQAIVKRAVEALRQGDAQKLGRLMQEAQENFDRYVQPACPSQLTAPVLHAVLGHEALMPYVYGGKGIGSQGDGSAQFIARDQDSQEKAIEIIKRDFGLSSLEMVIPSTRRVRKAVIPAAGFGTRLFPATKAVKKELFPVIDSQGRAKPAILTLIEEALSAGIEEIAIIVQPDDQVFFEEVLCQAPSEENWKKLSAQQQEYATELMEIGQRITFLTQDRQEGFGHAIHCSRDWVGDEPFLLLLGDHLYASHQEESCARQLIDAYESSGRSTVAVQETPGSQVHLFGCVAGTWNEDGSTLTVESFSEKPSREYADEHLVVPGLGPDTFLTVFGQYVLTPSLFEFLEHNIQDDIREAGEFQLTSCLDAVRRHEGFTGCRIAGERFDIGNPKAYLDTLAAFSRAAVPVSTKS